MKFGALLRTSAGEVPELQELFTAYKQLKKHLKVRCCPTRAGSGRPRRHERLENLNCRLEGAKYLPRR